MTQVLRTALNEILDKHRAGYRQPEWTITFVLGCLEPDVYEVTLPAEVLAAASTSDQGRELLTAAILKRLPDLNPNVVRSYYYPNLLAKYGLSDD